MQNSSLACKFHIVYFEYNNKLKNIIIFRYVLYSFIYKYNLEQPEIITLLIRFFIPVSGFNDLVEHLNL